MWAAKSPKMNLQLRGAAKNHWRHPSAVYPRQQVERKDKMGSNTPESHKLGWRHVPITEASVRHTVELAGEYGEEIPTSQV